MSSEIEYLEEYKDLICPDVRGGHGRNLSAAPPPHDEDSSSIDQDIFERLFEDNSDDENSQTKKKSTKTSPEESSSLDSLDMLCKDLGEQLSAPTPKTIDAIQFLPVTTAPTKSEIILTSQTISSDVSLQQTTGVKQSLLKTKQPDGSSSKSSEMSTTLSPKLKSVATVRPTLQQQHCSQKARLNSIDTAYVERTSSSDRPSTSKASHSCNAHTGNLTLSSTVDGVSTGGATTRRNRPQPTIFKPVKHQSKDPTEDPLSLDDIPDDLDYETDNDSYSLSDISGDSYVSLSDLDEDTRNIIDLSNDSPTNATDYEKLGALTPSPTVSDYIERHCQHNPDFEDDLSMSSPSTMELNCNKSSDELKKSLTMVSNWKIKSNVNCHGKAIINSQLIDNSLENTTDEIYEKLIDVKNRNILHLSSLNNGTEACAVHSMGSISSSIAKEFKNGKILKKNKVKSSVDQMLEVQHRPNEIEQKHQLTRHSKTVTEGINQDTLHKQLDCKIQKQENNKDVLNQIGRTIDNFVNDNVSELPYVYDIAMDDPIMEEIITTDDIGSEEDRASQIIMESLEASNLKEKDLTITSVQFIETPDAVEIPNVKDGNSCFKGLIECNNVNRSDKKDMEISKKTSNDIGSKSFDKATLNKTNETYDFTDVMVSNYTSLSESNDKKSVNPSSQTNDKLQIFKKKSVKTPPFCTLKVQEDYSKTLNDSHENCDNENPSNSFAMGGKIMTESGNSFLKNSNKNSKTFVKNKDQNLFFKNNPNATEKCSEQSIDEKCLQMPSNEDGKIVIQKTKCTKYTSFKQLKNIPVEVSNEYSDVRRDNNEIPKDALKDIAKEETQISKTQPLTKLSSSNTTTSESKDHNVNALETAKILNTPNKETFRKEKFVANTNGKEDELLKTKITDENKALKNLCEVNDNKYIEEQIVTSNVPTILQMPEIVNINSNKKSEMSSKLITEENKSWETSKPLADILFVSGKHKRAFETKGKDLLNKKYASALKKRICQLEQKQEIKEISTDEKCINENVAYSNEIINKNNLTNDEKKSVEINESKNVTENLYAIEIKTGDTKKIHCTRMDIISKRKRRSDEITNETNKKKKIKITEYDSRKRLLRQRVTESDMDVEKKITETSDKSTSAEPPNDTQCAAEVQITKKETEEAEQADNRKIKSPEVAMNRSLQTLPKLSTTVRNSNIIVVTENDNNVNSNMILDTSIIRKKSTEERSPTTKNINANAKTENGKDDKILAEVRSKDKEEYSQSSRKKSKAKSGLSMIVSPSSNPVYVATKGKESIPSDIKTPRKTIVKTPKLLGFEKSGVHKSESSTTSSIEKRNTQVISTKRKQLSQDERKEEPPNKMQRLERNQVPVESLKSKPSNVARVRSPKHNENVSELTKKYVDNAEAAGKVRTTIGTHEVINSEPIKQDLPIEKIIQEDDKYRIIKAQHLPNSSVDNSSTALPDKLTSIIVPKHNLKNKKTKMDLPTLKSFDEPVSEPIQGDALNIPNSSNTAGSTVKKKRGVSTSKKDSLVGYKNAISQHIPSSDTGEITPKPAGIVLTFAEWLRCQKSKKLQRPLDSDSSTPSDMERVLNEEETTNLLSPSLEISRNKNAKPAKLTNKSKNVSNDDSTKERASHSVAEESTNESPTMRSNQKSKKSELDVLKDSMPSDMLQLVENHKDNVRVLKKRSIVTPVPSKGIDSDKNGLEIASKLPSITPRRPDIHPRGIRKQTKISGKLTPVGKVSKAGYRTAKTQQFKIKNLRIILDEDFVPNYLKKLKETPNKINTKQEEDPELEKETLLVAREDFRPEGKVKQKLEVTRQINIKNKNPPINIKDANNPNPKKCGSVTELTGDTSPKVIPNSIPSQTSKSISQIKQPINYIIPAGKNIWRVSPLLYKVWEEKRKRAKEKTSSEMALPVVKQNPISQKNSKNASNYSSVETEGPTVRMLSNVAGRTGGVLTIPLGNRRPPPSVTEIKESAKKPTTTITTSVAATNSHNVEIRDKSSVARVLCSDLIKPIASERIIAVNQHDKTVLVTEISASEESNTSISPLANSSKGGMLAQALDVISNSTNMQVDVTNLEPKLEIEYEERNPSNIAENLTLLVNTSILESDPIRPLNAFGVTPPSVDSNGTRLYSFLHPAKYNKNHCSVLLDYCCPNLDGPMAAIDPTRIHAQVQTVVRELPSYIVMKTELITRADLETNRGNIPASIRQKVEKITAGVSTVGSSMAITGNTGIAGSLSPTLTALQNKLPATTSLTPKAIPSITVITKTTSNVDSTMKNSNSNMSSDPAPISTTAVVDSPPPLTHFSSFMSPCALVPKPISSTSMGLYERNALRSSWRRLDAFLKKHGQRILTTSYLERGRCIESIVNEHSSVLTASEVDTAERVLDLFVNRLKTYGGGSSTKTITGAKSNLATPCVDQTIASSLASTQHTHHETIKTNIPADANVSKSLKLIKGVGALTGNAPNNAARSSGRRNVPIYDSDQNIIGYQMQVVKSLSATTTSSSIAVTQAEVQTQRRVQQNSQRIFHTKTQIAANTVQSSQCSTFATPTMNTLSSSLINSSTGTVLRNNTTDVPKRLDKNITTQQVPLKNLHTSTQIEHNQHQANGKRTTRKTAATAAAATTTEIIVVSKNNVDGNNAQPAKSTSLSVECILPDDNNQSTQIKREEVDEDFIGGN